MIIKVEKGIPIPDKTRATIYPWAKLTEPKDSILIPCKDEAQANSIRTAAFNYAKRKDMVFTTRWLKKEGGIRIWRQK